MVIAKNDVQTTDQKMVHKARLMLICQIFLGIIRTFQSTMADVTVTTAVPSTADSVQSSLAIAPQSNPGHNSTGQVNDLPASVNNSSSPASFSTSKPWNEVNSVPPVVVLNKQRLQELINEIDPCEQLDEEAEEVILQMADDFIESIVTSSCQIAKHRGSKSLEVRDVQLVLEKNFNMNIPGFGNTLSGLNRLKSHSSTTEAHKQRMALIRKTLKKF